VNRPDDRQGRRRPGALESEILEILTRADAALTPGELRDRLDPSRTLSYSAVVTTLTRLYAKKAVTREREGRAYRYTAVADRSTLVAWRMRRLLNTDADPETVLSHFVSELSESDAALLRELLGREPDDT